MSPPAPTIALLRLPGLRGEDPLAALRAGPDVRVVDAAGPGDLDGATRIVLPDIDEAAPALAWLRERRLDLAIARHADAGCPVLGLGGSLALLGEALVDLDDFAGNAPGLGLLPLVTLLDRSLPARPVDARFATLPPPWAALSGLRWQGELHAGGRTEPRADLPPPHAALATAEGSALGWQSGSVLGLALPALPLPPAELHALLAGPIPPAPFRTAR